eukprot:MONOS_4218.1-p1 / transcript=MONOS_4218.1 / gene=MONOS_4218 / organism=Monocercomonoides_exilis_PA203 / gene_product=unspecified product / transcript_product=unspecified product / location=Mono_scaffold00109:71332-71682(+) / protein_length=76 / sequence_SO=supercontig / SO=protein_coding / is_pseudo=false
MEALSSKLECLQKWCNFRIERFRTPELNFINSKISKMQDLKIKYETLISKDSSILREIELEILKQKLMVEASFSS